MFWGLIMEPGKKYSQTVEKSFHVSHAALDLDSAKVEPVQVLLGFENRNYLLCTLIKDKWVQVPLDLNFQAGDKVSFATNGPGHVHLTGYLIPEDDISLMDEESDEEEENEVIPELLPMNNKKRKAEVKSEKQNKKSKSETAKLLEEINEDDTDDEDDSDVNLNDLLDDEVEEEEEEEDEDDVDQDDDDDDDDDEDVEESEEEVKPVQKQKKDKPKQNGIVKLQQKAEKSPKQNEKSPKQNKQNEKSPKPDQKSPKQSKKRTIQGGVVVEDLKVGEGAVATTGRNVQVYYEGRLQANNKVFDSTKKGNGFKFRLGKQEVIKGWDVGVAGMKVGGKRRIICPPHMAYGVQGSPPVIPPGSTLIFEVELRNVK